MHQKMKFGIIVTDDDPYWGGEVGVGKWFQARLEIRNSTHDEFVPFYAITGKLPTHEEMIQFDGFVLTGSHHSVNEPEQWIANLTMFIRKAYHRSLDYGRPRLFGMCFGHQVIAKAMGGKIGKNPDGKFNFGSVEVEVNEAFFKEDYVKPQFQQPNQRRRRRSSIQIMKFHGECVLEVPPAAMVIGSSDQCKTEMLKYGDTMLTTQGHPEYHKKEMLENNSNIMKRESVLDLEELKKGLRNIEDEQVDQTTETVRLFLRHKGKTAHPEKRRRASIMTFRPPLEQLAGLTLNA